MLKDSTMTLSIVPYIDCVIDKRLLYRSGALELNYWGSSVSCWTLYLYIQHQRKFRLRTFAGQLQPGWARVRVGLLKKINLVGKLLGSAQVTIRKLASGRTAG